MTTSFRITFVAILGFVSLYLINPAIAVEAIETDEDVALYADNDGMTDADIADGDMADDDMADDDMADDDIADDDIADDDMADDDIADGDTADDGMADDDTLADDGDAALVSDNDSTAIDDASEIMDSDSDASAQAGGGSAHVMGKGKSCKKPLAKLTLYLTANGIPSGHSYVKQGGQIGFRNKDNVKHTITVVPGKLLQNYKKPIPVIGSSFSWVTKTSKAITGRLEDNFRGGSTTSHALTVCP